MKYAVDSAGEVFRLSDTNSNTDVAVRCLSSEARTNELNTFIAKFFGESDKKFCLMLNKDTVIERVVFFTKTQLSSSSQDVKLANELEHHPEIKDKKRKYLQSIYSDNSGVSSWYYLGVGSIEFERNMYDGKYINACYVPPVPYTLFKKQLDAELKDYKLLNIGLELNYPKALLEMAFDRDSDTMSKGANPENSKDAVQQRIAHFDLEICQALERYKQANGYDRRDKDSNKANSCIAAITEYKENCFPVYQQVKNCIKKTFKGAYNIRYKGNYITAQLDESHTLTLYVVENDPALIIIGGNVYDIDDLKNALTSPELFEETKWFAEKVKPVIDGTIN